MGVVSYCNDMESIEGNRRTVIQLKAAKPDSVKCGGTTFWSDIFSLTADQFLASTVSICGPQRNK